MKCLAFPKKPCSLLTCYTKKRCLWTVEDLRVKLQDPFKVLDALRGHITGEYVEDLKRLHENNQTCTEEVYNQAYQIDQQP